MAREKEDDKLTGVAAQIDDITAFPIMVSDGYTAMLGAPAAPPPSGPSGDLGATASSAIKNALGWTWRPGADPKGLMGALNSSFKAVPRQGRVDYQYQQRNYAVAIQADMGTITGAQASVYTRAKAILDQMLLLLTGLTPLLPDPDLSETEAMRALVRTEINDVVQQLGAEGGPNVQLVDKAFVFLGGPIWNIKGSGTSPKRQMYDNIRGHLGGIRSAFGFDESWVNTIDEEQDLTNFIVLVDYVNDLFSSWRANRPSFVVGSAKQTFMGTQLVQVSRGLAVVSEAVDQLCYVLETVFIGKAEQQTLKIEYGPNQPPIFLGDLLEWIRNFVTSEGQQIISASGKEGVLTFTATAERLRDLVAGLKKASKVPAGFKTKRVQDAIDNLFKQLQESIDEAKHIRRYQPPKIEWVELDAESGRIRVTVYGRNLSDSATISIGYTQKGKHVIAEVEEHGLTEETFASGPSTATAFFDQKDLKTAVGQGLRELTEIYEDLPEGKFGLHLVIRNGDDQADATALSETNHKVVLA